MQRRPDSNQRRVHLVVGGVCIGGCDLPVAASTSDEPDTSGAICRRCQKALEKLFTLFGEARWAIEQELSAAGDEEVKQHPALAANAKLVEKMRRFRRQV